jgi:hypothetical protein
MYVISIQPPQNPPRDPQSGGPREGEQPVPLLASWLLILVGVILAVYYLNKLRRFGGRE